MRVTFISYTKYLFTKNIKYGKENCLDYFLRFFKLFEVNCLECNRSFRIYVTRRSRRNGFRPSQSLSCTFLEMTSPDAARASLRSRDTLRRVLATPITKVVDSIWFKRREGRYGGRFSYRFSRARIRAAFSLEICWLFAVSHVFLLHRNYDTLSRVGKWWKTEIYYFPCVIYASGGLISGIFKVAEAYFFLAYARALSYFCIARLDATGIYARRTMIPARTLVHGSRSPA